MTTDRFPNAKGFYDGVFIYTKGMAQFITGNLLRAGIDPEEVVADSLRQDAIEKFRKSRQRDNVEIWEAIDFGFIPDMVAKSLPGVDRNLTNKMFVIREFRNEAVHEYIQKGRDISTDMSETALYLMADVLNRVGDREGGREVWAVRDRFRQGSVLPGSGAGVMRPGGDGDGATRSRGAATAHPAGTGRAVAPAGSGFGRREGAGSGVQPPAGFGGQTGRFSHRADVLNFASMFYRGQLFDYDVPQQMLAKMGISAEGAANAGIGFCSGRGLREYLESKNLDRNEIQGSPLFSRDSGGESFAGQMVISDLGPNGKAVWMTSVPIERGPAGHWERFAPFPKGMPGRRHSDIVKNEARTPCDIMTNDARLYIALASSDLRAALMTYLPRQSDDLETLCSYVCAKLVRTETTRLSLVMHNHDMLWTLTDKIYRERPEVEVFPHGWDAILKNLDPETRDLGALWRQPV